MSQVLVEIRGGQGGLLDRIQFVTSRGRESKAYGGSGGDAFSFKATAPPPPACCRELLHTDKGFRSSQIPAREASDGKMIVGLRRAAFRLEFLRIQGAWASLS